MKKFIIVLLTVLLVFSLTSCKDNGDELVATYEEFSRYYTLTIRLRNYLGFTDEEIKDIDAFEVERIVSYYYNSDIDVKSVTNAVGTVKETEDGNKTTTEWKDVVIDYKYTEGSDSTEKEGKLTISGTYVYESDTSRAQSTYSVNSFNFTINNTSFTLNYRTDEGRFTTANVNGKDVNLRLLNAGV